MDESLTRAPGAPSALQLLTRLQGASWGQRGKAGCIYSSIPLNLTVSMETSSANKVNKGVLGIRGSSIGSLLARWKSNSSAAFGFI